MGRRKVHSTQAESTATHEADCRAPGQPQNRGVRRTRKGFPGKAGERRTQTVKEEAGNATDAQHRATVPGAPRAGQPNNTTLTGQRPTQCGHVCDSLGSQQGRGAAHTPEDSRA